MFNNDTISKLIKLNYCVYYAFINNHKKLIRLY